MLYVNCNEFQLFTYTGGTDISFSNMSCKSSKSGIVGISSLESGDFFGIMYSLKYWNYLYIVSMIKRQIDPIGHLKCELPKYYLLSKI